MAMEKLPPIEQDIMPPLLVEAPEAGVDTLMAMEQETVLVE